MMLRQRLLKGGEADHVPLPIDTGRRVPPVRARAIRDHIQMRSS
ncbi:hypothetical protein [Roseovarius sp. SCSIO 43702]|nr:hypothetical protein [Roseovarius sp. SCSIO 43702]